MSDDTIEEKQRRMKESEARVRALIRSYRTEQGTVFTLPDFNDPEVLKIHMIALEDAHRYFSAAKHLKQATTYRFNDVQRNLD